MAVRASSSSRLISLVKSSDLALWRSGIFSVIGARSLGAYLWDTMMEAGQEWDAVPIGRAALRALRED